MNVYHNRLQYHAGYVSLTAILIYFILHIIFANNRNPDICHVDHEYAPWVLMCVFAECCGFYANSLLQLVRVANAPKNKISSSLRWAHFAVFCINFMAGTSSLVQFRFGWGGLCGDVFK